MGKKYEFRKNVLLILKNVRLFIDTFADLKSNSTDHFECAKIVKLQSLNVIIQFHETLIETNELINEHNIDDFCASLIVITECLKAIDLVLNANTLVGRVS
ncbi:MAG: hypothetical protein H7177_12835 [Rhizobacter sp.]|nr:hypothetical protein [Bacteriovorax sp.]